MKLDSIPKHLLADEVVLMPTDTVYGLVCSVYSKTAVLKIFDTKKRINKLGTLLFADEKQLLDFGFEKNLIDKASEHWPGPTSIVLPCPIGKEYLAKEWNSLAVRIPEPKWLHELLLQSGPIVTTSANYPDKPTAINIEEAKRTFRDKVALYVDGGELNNPPSTILKLTDSGFEKLR